MNELTLRLPAETTTALESEADERGVPLDVHIRDIIDAYRAADSSDRPVLSVEYRHAGGTVDTDGEEETSEDSEEIGSFSYGSRSICSR